MPEPGSDDGDEVARTRAVYEEHAEAFSEKYRSGSVAARFWDEVSAEMPESGGEADTVRVLDAGCGPGADAATFAERGYEVVGVDVTPPFLRDAADYAPDGRFVGGDARRLPLAEESVDAVWACASLLHLSRDDVPDALAEFRRVLRPSEVLFATFKRGTESGYDLDGTGRFFVTYEPEGVAELVENAGFEGELLRVEGVEDDGQWLRVVASR